jgi:hypothetical protein
MIQVPGKIFILGEYSVMKGGEAVIASLQPSFECIADSEQRLHPDSPAGRWLADQGFESGMKVQGGIAAGFGTSTAELIAVRERLAPTMSDRDLWSWYRERFFPASGADLAVQMDSMREGLGLYQFQIHAADYRMHRVSVPYLFLSNCYLFRCPPIQKIPTYSDLENRKQGILDDRLANGFVHRWLKDFDPAILTEWADHLSHLGFESLFGRDVRQAFQAIPGVVGVKGCGAGLNDAFLVCLDQSQPHETQKGIRSVVEKFNLITMGSLYEHL